MSKKVGPYVGVTGFMSRAEVSEALAMVPQGSTCRLMVGVLMSSKTLVGQQNKWPGRYPKKEAVADIFIDDPRALNLVHYNTDHPETLLTQLIEITSSRVRTSMVSNSTSHGRRFHNSRTIGRRIPTSSSCFKSEARRWCGRNRWNDSRSLSARTCR